MSLPAYSPNIDWVGDGSWVDETARLESFTIRRGRNSGLSSSGGYNHVDVGTISLVLNNYDLRYDPWNTSGALYGNILPHRPFQFYATYEGVRYYLMSGWIRNPQPLDRDKTGLDGTDGIDWLQSARCPPGSLQSNYAVSEAMNDLFVGLGWPFVDSSGWLLGVSQLGVNNYLGSAGLENNGDVIPYWFPDHNKSIWQMIEELATAFAGDPYIKADGTFAYNARALGDVSKLTITQDLILKDIRRPQPWEEIRNDIQIIANPLKATAANTELWRLNYEPSISAGETLTIWANLAYNGTPCAQTSITTPVSGTDYTAGSTAGGTDKNAQIAIVKTDYANTVKLEITNNDAGTVYLSLCKIRGTGLYNYDETVIKDLDSTSKGKYGILSMVVDSPWIQDISVAKSHCGWAKMIYDSPRNIVYIRIEQRPEIQLSLDLFNQIDLDITALGISGSYYITHIEHTWQAGGPLISTFRCEPNSSQVGGIWLLGVGALGSTTVLGW